MQTGPQQTYERSRVFTGTPAWTNITEKQPETAAGRDISDLRSDSHFSLNVDPKTRSKFKLKCVQQAVQMQTGPQQTYERSRVFTVTPAWTNITEKQPETAAGRDISDLQSDSHFSLNVDPKTGSKFRLKCVRRAVQNANWTAADI